jgi:hypothetical protein
MGAMIFCVTHALQKNDFLYFTQSYCSSDFSRFLTERLKSLLRFHELLILAFFNMPLLN